MNVQILRVAADSKLHLVAGAIAGQMRENGLAQTQAIGTDAVYCMLKAIIIAQRYVTDENMRLAFIPEYVGVVVDSQKQTAVRLNICTQTPRPVDSQ